MINNIVRAAEQPLGTLKGTGPLGEFNADLPTTIDLFDKILSLIIGVLTFAAGLWFIFQIFTGALGWLTAGSDKAGLENARKRLFNAVIGLVLVIGAIFFIEVIGNILGLDILSPGSFLTNIWS
ncbi:MAG: hypothetical protein Q7S03_02055 [bacterium]|nr:hypothetical protein [bacterium]